jgi:hypothetical protein
VISIVDCFDVLIENTALAIFSSQSKCLKFTKAASVEAIDLLIFSTSPLVSGYSAEAFKCCRFHFSKNAKNANEVKHEPLSEMMQTGVL